LYHSSEASRIGHAMSPNAIGAIYTSSSFAGAAGYRDIKVCTADKLSGCVVWTASTLHLVY
jgi:hypothetical protein